MPTLRRLKDWLWPELSGALATLHANQLVIIALLHQVLAKESAMAVDLTKVTAAVANNTTVEASVVALLTQLTTIIKNIPPSNDTTTQAALDALTATLEANDATLAAAVVSNTPAA